MSQKVVKIRPGSYQYSQEQPFLLANQSYLNGLTLAYETYGELNQEKDNVILVHHSLSMSAHASSYYDHTTLGWWDSMIGVNKALDPTKYYIICINNLGSCFGSTGPTNYENFPVVTIHDMVVSQKLLLDYLDIKKLKLVVGSSMGGMLSLAWLQLYPNTLDKLFIAACSARAYPANIFNRMIQQEVINNIDGTLGLKIARMLGHSFYRGSEELNTRFADVSTQFSLPINTDYKDGVYKSSELYDYFSYNADKFIKQFDKNSYLRLLNAMDLFDLTIEKSYHPAGFPGANKSAIDIVVAGITSDLLFPMEQQFALFDLLKQYGYSPTFIEHDSSSGHDAFLIEDDKFGNYISTLLNDSSSSYCETLADSK